MPCLCVDAMYWCLCNFRVLMQCLPVMFRCGCNILVLMHCSGVDAMGVSLLDQFFAIIILLADFRFLYTWINSKQTSKVAPYISSRKKKLSINFVEVREIYYPIILHLKTKSFRKLQSHIVFEAMLYIFFPKMFVHLQVAFPAKNGALMARIECLAPMASILGSKEQYFKL